MPNWCNNTVTFKHENPKMIEKVVKGFNKGQLLAEFYPCPKELTETLAGARPKGTPEGKALEIQHKLNVETYGFADWYDWQTSNWGTKWDVGRDQNDPRKIKVKKGATEVTLSFDSAWSPPIPFYEKLHQEHQFEINARYFEPGCGFIGVWENGNDDTFDYTGFDTSREALDWLKENAPADLLADFGIEEWFTDMMGDSEETDSDS